ncbi:PREDICTED: acid sphingomyelinase-like phosphodiesterase 3b [Branchiostoma belcheri]|uniref:Sphingomyelinase phosphodiesterase n=1 Tax=Branchiostoma belcheri TaxID=7741 RepID=A0A6P5AWJ6_BRABE|nr:PREDICTED: acid sphingomyelinase-like phosphodiesterase 3b [Branchiostoma belcheri]
MLLLSGLYLAVAAVLPTLTVADTGRFWFIADFHYDPSYMRPHRPGKVCDSLGVGMDPPANPGPWGDYSCDPPWRTINSSIFAMKAIDPNPDFILRGGDDVPHVDRGALNYTSRTVVSLLSNVTRLLEEVFPGVPVYSSLGNHDYWIKNQLPDTPNDVYNDVATLWLSGVGQDAMDTFRRGGYYSAPLRRGLRVIGLNTNLWYGRNQVTEGEDDPAGQFAWLEETLQQARQNVERVYIIGHVAPGTHERIYTKRDFRPNHNKRYIGIVRKYADVISGQMFAHEHYDTFRMFYDEEGAPISTVFLSPAITPWMRRNNPAFRQYVYNRDTGELQDYLQYYANLTKANRLQLTDLDWQLEYQATVDYGIDDVNPVSMETLRKSLNEVPSDAFEKYYKHNSVGVDYVYGSCIGNCRAAQLCSTYRVDYDEYDVCWKGTVAGVTCQNLADVMLTVLALAVMAVVCHLV